MNDLSTVEPSQVLIEYDGPLLFRAASAEHDLLVRVTDRGDDAWQCLAVPTTDDVIAKLESGAMTVRSALTKTTSRPRLLDVHLPGWTVQTNTVLTTAAEIEEYLPPPGLMLRADLQPLLSVKLEGPDLRAGRTPRAAWIHAFRDVPEAMKTLLDFMLGQEGRGRPSEATRALYSLPAQSLKFASLEVSFGRPDGLHADPDNLFEELGRLFEKTLMAVEGDVLMSSPEERDAILLAASKLAPPSRGVVHRVSFAGPLAGRGSQVVLDRRARREINAKRKKRPSPIPRVRTLAGQVREADLDQHSFQFRGFETDGTGDMRVLFDEEEVNEILWALETEVTVTTVVLVLPDGTARLLALGADEADE